MALRCLFGTMGLLGNFYAVDHLMLAHANILDKLDPFFCIQFSAAFLGEGFTCFQAAAVAGAWKQGVFCPTAGGNRRRQYDTFHPILRNGG